MLPSPQDPFSFPEVALILTQCLPDGRVPPLPAIRFRENPLSILSPVLLRPEGVQVLGTDVVLVQITLLELSDREYAGELVNRSKRFWSLRQNLPVGMNALMPRLLKSTVTTWS